MVLMSHISYQSHTDSHQYLLNPYQIFQNLSFILKNTNKIIFLRVDIRFKIYKY